MGVIIISRVHTYRRIRFLLPTFFYLFSDAVAVTAPPDRSPKMTSPQKSPPEPTPMDTSISEDTTNQELLKTLPVVRPPKPDDPDFDAKQTAFVTYLIRSERNAANMKEHATNMEVKRRENLTLFDETKKDLTALYTQNNMNDSIVSFDAMRFAFESTKDVAGAVRQAVNGLTMLSKTQAAKIKTLHEEYVNLRAENDLLLKKADEIEAAGNAFKRKRRVISGNTGTEDKVIDELMKYAKRSPPSSSSSGNVNVALSQPHAYQKLFNEYRKGAPDALEILHRR